MATVTVEVRVDGEWADSESDFEFWFLVSGFWFLVSEF